MICSEEIEAALDHILLGNGVEASLGDRDVLYELIDLDLCELAKLTLKDSNGHPFTCGDLADALHKVRYG